MVSVGMVEAISLLDPELEGEPDVKIEPVCVSGIALKPDAGPAPDSVAEVELSRLSRPTPAHEFSPELGADFSPALVSGPVSERETMPESEPWARPTSVKLCHLASGID